MRLAAIAATPAGSMKASFRAIDKPRARHRSADDAVDDNERDVDSRRPEMTRHRISERALRHLALSERRRAGRAPPRGRGPDHDNGALPSAAHRRDHLPGGEEQAKRVDPPGALEVLRLDLFDIPPDARACIEYQHIDIAEIGSDLGEGRIDRGLIGDIAGVSLGAREFGRELARQFGAPSQERDGVAVRGEAPGEGLAIAGADADHRAHRSFGIIRHRSVLPERRSGAARAPRSLRSRSSLSCNAGARGAIEAEFTDALPAPARAGRAPPCQTPATAVRGSGSPRAAFLENRHFLDKWASLMFTVCSSGGEWVSRRLCRASRVTPKLAQGVTCSRSRHHPSDPRIKSDQVRGRHKAASKDNSGKRHTDALFRRGGAR